MDTFFFFAVKCPAACLRLQGRTVQTEAGRQGREEDWQTGFRTPAAEARTGKAQV